MRRTASVTSHSSVLMWISGDSGASYGAEMPVNSVYVLAPSTATDGRQILEWDRAREAHTFDFPGACLLVQALGITLLYHIQRRIHEHLDESQASFIVDLSCDSTIGAVRRDEGGDSDACRVRKQFRDLSGTA